LEAGVVPMRLRVGLQVVHHLLLGILHLRGILRLLQGILHLQGVFLQVGRLAGVLLVAVQVAAQVLHLADRVCLVLLRV